MWILGVILIAALMIGCVYMTLCCMMRIDEDHGMDFTDREVGVLIICSLVSAGIWSMTMLEETELVRLAWLLLHIYFLSCSMTDMMTCQVYDLFQYFGVLAGAYLILQSQANILTGISILLFSVLQYVVFMRLYGAADGMAFLISALAEGALGYNINMYLVHMIISYLLLSGIQFFYGNIGYRGKLKKPVAFVPYIMTGFWIILILGDKIHCWI